MKKFSKIILLVLSLCLALCLVACDKDNGQSGGDDHTHSWGDGVVTKQATYNADGEKTYTCSCGQTQKETIPSLIPTEAQVSQGIQTAKNDVNQNYNFKINLSGNVNVMGYSGTANANYDGKYRFNTQTKDLTFMRETSGILLYDSREYIYTEGDSRIKIVTNPSDVMKKLSIIPKEDEELDMVNLPFIKLVQALDAENLSSIQKQSGQYRFSAKMLVASNNEIINKLLGKIEKMGSNITIKDVSFNNPQGGIDFNFNLTDEGKLADFSYSISVSFPVSGQSVTIALKYEQINDSSAITSPTISGYAFDSATVESKVSSINSAITALKNTNTYSLDFVAKNDFDAGWNHNALVDKYTARMYKNVNSTRVDFNHSYKYKSHTEEDGAESFAYTVGNVITDDKVYEISRKGSNTQTERNGVTADSRFDIMTGDLVLDAADVDFIKTTNNSDGSITYRLFLKDSANTAIQQNIANLINSNTAPGVIPVENYFNSSAYTIEEGVYEMTVKNGILVGCNVEIEMRYTPVGGQYTDDVITLKNSIELAVNENYDKASEYVAPNNVNTTIGHIGLNNSKYYIL